MTSGASPPLGRPALSMVESPATFLDGLLPAMWLRPERATFDVLLWYPALRLMQELWSDSSLEFGINSGLVTFVGLGGRVSSDYDDYLDVTPTSLASTDVFASVGEHVPIAVASPARTRVSRGIAIKPEHAIQARRFGVFERVVVAEGLGSAIGVDDHGHGIVWAPGLLVDELVQRGWIRGLASKVRSGGHVVVPIPTRRQTALARQLLDRFSPRMLQRFSGGFLKDLARGTTILEDYEREFKELGFRVVADVPTVKPYQFVVYAFGIRCVFRELLSTVVALRRDPDRRSDVAALKAEFVRSAQRMLRPVVDDVDAEPDEALWRVVAFGRGSA